MEVHPNGAQNGIEPVPYNPVETVAVHSMLSFQVSDPRFYLCTPFHPSPQALFGPPLGGLWRMRGYPSQRFNDKAAVYYAAELRLIPDWNPFDRWRWIQKHVGVQWLQFVPFVEIGRVAPDWDFSELHSDMHWCAGLGLRAWAKGLVVRIDTAYSEEGLWIQMMISQPFQF